MGYDSQTLDRWRRELQRYARAIPPQSPRSSVLLVVDAQRYFASLCDPILESLNQAIRGCRDRGISLIFTRHGHAKPDVDGGMLHCWWGDSIVEGTPDHELLPELDVRAGDRILAKRRYSAFHNTGLHENLRILGVEDVAIAGVMTNLCVETTARDAFVRDYRVHVLMDAAATSSAELHEASLMNLAFGFAHVQTVDEWLAGFEG